MSIAKARVSMPAQAKKGEIIEIKTLIRHVMETGYRVDSRGKNIPRDIVTKLTVSYDGIEIFVMDFTQGVAANPYVRFWTRALENGELVFTWRDAKGSVATVKKTLRVAG